MTKTTLRRINKHTRFVNDSYGVKVPSDNYITQMDCIAEFLVDTNTLNYDEHGRLIYNSAEQEHISGHEARSEYSMKIFSGLYSRYSDYVYCVSTNGFNWIEIKDVDKLVRFVEKDFCK